MKLARRNRRRPRGSVALAALAVLVSIGMAAALVLAVAVGATPLPPELREAGASGSILVQDRDGRTLREVRASDGTRARWVGLGELGAPTRHAILAAEDARFYSHPGVDPLALARAAASDVWHRRIVSGGSTLTMQLARVVRPHPRSLWGKVREVVLALRIEASLSKDQILEQYVNRASFGPNLRGMAAASQAYFDKSVGSLSLAEAALLAGLPRGPSVYQVARHPERARLRRDRVLARMAVRGWIVPGERERAEAEPVRAQAAHPAFGAPHFVAAVLSGALAKLDRRPMTALRTTLDAGLQRTAEAQVAATVDALRGKGVTAASAVVVENASGDILAYVGSPDFFDDAHGGQNDGVRAQRQPGSTLKPFLYELAMEKDGFDPSTRLPDVELHLPVEGGVDYAPRDYDGRFRGPVRLRDALGNSLNVPAVWTLREVGVDGFLARLRDLGFASLTQDGAYYGPGLALGDGEVTLLELVRAYATLARGGIDLPLRAVSRVERPGASASAGVDADADVAPSPERRVMTERFANLVVDVLKDHDARASSFGERSVLDFPFDVAAKTGTSKGYRDNWTVGFTKAVTVGVWVGNFDGEPMTNVSGITGAGPLFHAILEGAMLGRPREPLPIGNADREGLERVDVCALSGELAGPSCPHRVAEWRPKGASHDDTCTMHVRLRVDRETGLRAGSACAPDQAVERIFEQYPPELGVWAEAVGRPIAPRAWSPSCPPSPADLADGASSERSTDAVRIVYPPGGARFVIDPDRPRETQRLDVTIQAPAGAEQATLVVDGEAVAHVRAPFQASWALRGGDHELVAEADGTRSAPVRIRVRD